jgi:hypothetical protein
MDFSFKSDYNFLFIPLMIAASSLAAYLYYKHSRLDSLKKTFLSSLRFLSVFFILLNLLSPVLSFIKNNIITPVNVFLVDNSLSITIEGRQENLNKILSKTESTVPGNSDNLYYAFSDNLMNEIKGDELKSLNFSGKDNFNTNLTASLNSLQDILRNKYISSVTVISDGIINAGGNPLVAAKSMNVPFNYFLTGDTVQKKDVLIKNIFYNKKAFRESNVPVIAEINSYNIDRDIRISLFEDDKEVESKILNVNTGKNNYEVNFNVNSGTEAIKKYKVQAEQTDGEITYLNNSEEFFIKFTDNKFKVLVLAGGPNPDFAFLKEEILKVKNFEPTFLTQKSSGEFYEGTPENLDSYDSYILIGFPTSITNVSLLNEISEMTRKNKSSLLFFAGRNTDYKKLSVLEGQLPFRVISISESEEETGVKSVSNIDQSIFKKAEILTSVNGYPNIFKTATVFAANSTAETILLSGRNSEPAFVIDNTSTGKCAAFLTYGFYKWRLNNQNNNSGDVLSFLITSSVLALTDKESKNKFNIETTKPVYSPFQNVKFDAVIGNYELKGNEIIKIRISGGEYKSELNLLRQNNKIFTGEINIPVKGNYDYTAELFSGDKSEQEIRGKFIVDDDNFEFKTTKADNSVLSVLSAETGGKNFTNLGEGDINSFLKEINSKSKSEIKSLSSIEFNTNPYFLYALIFLLCLEWFFRKRNNLP